MRHLIEFKLKFIHNFPHDHANSFKIAQKPRQSDKNMSGKAGFAVAVRTINRNRKLETTQLETA